MIERLKSFKGSSQFKRETMNILVKMISASTEEVTNLRKQFELLDKDGDGTIDARELVGL